MEQAEQDVLGPDEVVVQEARLVLGSDKDTPALVGEALEHPTSRMAHGRQNRYGPVCHDA
jgi:hypothetical protein